MKSVIVFFDYESLYGMPFQTPYDIHQATKNILVTLHRHNVIATFNICGKIANDDPKLIRSIAAQGHEISVHGFSHEDMARMPIEDINEILDRSERAIHKAIGIRPVGFRAPYMLGPLFYRKDIYELLEKRKYIWASNRHTAMSNRVFPSAIPPKIRSLTMPIINPNVILVDSLNESQRNPLKAARWLLGERDPFFRGKILEIPDSSSLDCSLLGLPKPEDASSPQKIQRAIKLLNQQFDEAANLFCLNMHDWIIGTENRIEVLDEVLKYIFCEKDSTSQTASELTKLNDK